MSVQVAVLCSFQASDDAKQRAGCVITVRVIFETRTPIRIGASVGAVFHVMGSRRGATGGANALAVVLALT